VKKLLKYDLPLKEVH